MAENKTLIRAHRHVDQSAERIWTLLMDETQLASFFSPTAAVSLRRDGERASGTMQLGKLNFAVQLAPHDLLLKSEVCAIALRVLKMGTGCGISMAASYDPASGFSVQLSDLERVLDRIAEAAGPATVSFDLSQGEPDAAETEAPAAAPPRAARRKTIGRRRALFAVAAVLVLALAVFAGGRLLARRQAEKVSVSAANAQDLSANVNYANAMALQLGAKRADVEKLFGTAGIREGNARIYRSAALAQYGRPAEQVRVQYQNDAITAFTYLNAANAAQNLETPGTAIPTDAVHTPDELAAATGLPVSMVRRYTSGTDEMQEVHFGGCDRFANFDPAWRGEVAVLENVTQNTVAVTYWVTGNAADATSVAALEAGTPLAAEYDDYTTYLEDKFQFDRALILLQGYSYGDAAKWFPDMQAYDTGSGARAFKAVYGSWSQPGDTPYTLSYMLDLAGGFSMGSFANTRLYAKTDTLAGTRCASVTENMTYNEVRELVGLVPTALFVNDKSYFVCYGDYLGGTKIERQFRFVVRFDRATGLVSNVSSSVAAAAPGADSAAKE